MNVSHKTPRHSSAMILLVLCCTLITISLAIPVGGGRERQSFNDYPAGTVAAGSRPGGDEAPGTLFPDFTLSVLNGGSGPHSLILFDSAHPSGEDEDLGTPNETSGGPGVGVAGESGQPGENGEAFGNLLVIAEDLVDANPADGRVDDPDDEAGGGSIRFTFDEPAAVDGLMLIDIDENSRAGFTLYHGETLVGTSQAGALGDNSAELIQLAEYGAITRLDVDLADSGGIAYIDYHYPTTASALKTWGSIKKLFH